MIGLHSICTRGGGSRRTCLSTEPKPSANPGEITLDDRRRRASTADCAPKSYLSTYRVLGDETWFFALIRYLPRQRFLEVRTILSLRSLFHY